MTAFNEIKVFVGYDERESFVYHTCVQSILDNTSAVVDFIPLQTKTLREQGIYTREKDPKQSNEFSFTRFLVPYLSGYVGRSVFMDCDIVVQGDLLELYEQMNPVGAVGVVQHDYEPKLQTKYFGQKQYRYPKKNWSSVMIFNNGLCQQLTVDYVNQASGLELHQFKWLGKREPDTLPITWNWLVNEYEENNEAKLLHYTNGAPCIDGFENSDSADVFWKYAERVQRAREDDPQEMCA